ncbi:hypothetical protein GWK16_19300 [Roseomonas sp. JC162]|uniref:Uncharacterized protein n=1 Tax=Neoroseomonas marina TaxID=1232220 RepID=A0A848EFJ7_9PROT|nr:hypothetical protein [Neoroseomonas marina]NMJ43404.1 hypothetical protein [Neoroseomonas marina]
MTKPGLLLSRRAVLAGGVAGWLAPRPGRAARQVLMGAIRWDAWQAPGSPTTKAVERSLSPAEYRRRLPFFADVDRNGSIRIDGSAQQVMDREIALARSAHLDFFAFVAYPRGSAMSRGLELFLSSQARDGMRFCMICELRNWGTAAQPAALIREHATLMRSPDHLRTADGRPVYFLGFVSERLVVERWGGPEGLQSAVRDFRAAARDAGAADPFFVLMARPELAGLARQIGADALGAYTIADGRAAGAPYADLATLAERRWDEMASTGFKVVPTAMAGWDRRPRVANPVPWEAWQRAGAGMQFYYEQGRPDEIAAHVARCRDWSRNHEASAGLGLIYAWNENDEGGWLVPTRPFDDSRLRALRDALAR